MFRGLQHVVPSHLADTRLFDFAGLARARSRTRRDLAVDREPLPLFPLAALAGQPDADEHEAGD